MGESKQDSRTNMKTALLLLAFVACATALKCNQYNSIGGTISSNKEETCGTGKTQCLNWKYSLSGISTASGLCYPKGQCAAVKTALEAQAKKDGKTFTGWSCTECATYKCNTLISTSSVGMTKPSVIVMAVAALFAMAKLQ